jgi:hypothetical protein
MLLLKMRCNPSSSASWAHDDAPTSWTSYALSLGCCPSRRHHAGNGGVTRALPSRSGAQGHNRIAEISTFSISDFSIYRPCPPQMAGARSGVGSADGIRGSRCCPGRCKREGWAHSAASCEASPHRHGHGVVMLIADRVGDPLRFAERSRQYAGFHFTILISDRCPGARFAE